MRRIVCLTSLHGVAFDRLLGAFAGASIAHVETLEDIECASGRDAVLFCFGAGLIIPSHLLDTFGAAYNVHAAPPEFPGRDPHHHAVYRGCSTYGATLHRMAPKVDSGEIIDVERFNVARGLSPRELLEGANAAGIRLTERHGPAIARGKDLPQSVERWGDTKTSRADLIRLSMVDRFSGPEELARRYRSFDGDKYDNLTTELFGHLFRIDKKDWQGEKTTDDWSLFTEAGYRSVLASLNKAGYKFSTYHDRPEGRHVIWRHDVDCSLQRAVWCAQAEQDAGATGTYFVNPRSEFYNLAETSNLRAVHTIADLGHEIGLHFDASSLANTNWSADKLQEALARECDLFAAITRIQVRSVSWHNPGFSNLLDFDADQIGGLINAYGRSLRADYTYCSDSNGYWRFKPMPSVIAEGHERLHLLTHPGWWTPEPLPPRSRIERAVAGRASAVMSKYDRVMDVDNRQNLRS